MKHIFYFTAFAPILWELLVIFETKKVRRFWDRMIAKKNEGYNTNENAVSFLTFAYYVWIFVGFFTVQWPVFGLLLILAFFPKKFIPILFIDAVLSFSLLIFVVLNSYHLHIDVSGIFLQFIHNHI